MSGTVGQTLSATDKEAFKQRPVKSSNTIELISEFNRSKRQVISKNMQYRDWTEIFNLRDKSAAFTLEQMVKEKQELHGKKLQALPDFSSMRSLDTAADNKMGLTQNIGYSKSQWLTGAQFDSTFVRRSQPSASKFTSSGPMPGVCGPEKNFNTYSKPERDGLIFLDQTGRSES